jgi:hypothetical protein
MRQIWKGVQKSKYDSHSVTAATTAVAVSQAAVFGAIGVIVLIGLLMVKVLLLLSASGSEMAKRFGRVASVAMVKKWC